MFEKLLAQVSVQDQMKIMKYNRWQDKESHLIGRLIWNMALKNCNHSANEEINITEYGRPVWPLENGDANISHSVDRVVVAVSDYGSVGIDIERKSQIDINEYRTGFSVVEWESIIVENDGQLDAFYEMWTKKEAVIKADGRGWSNEKEAITWQGTIATLDTKKYHVSPLNRFSAYSCHVAASSNHGGNMMYIELTKLEGDRL